MAEILDDFKSRGWLSDTRFTEQLIHARKAKFGSARLKHELREKGIADHLILDAIDKFKETEVECGREVWLKKFKALPTSREEWAKQARFLQSRGFGFDVIKKILNESIHDD